MSLQPGQRLRSCGRLPARCAMQVTRRQPLVVSPWLPLLLLMLVLLGGCGLRGAGAQSSQSWDDDEVHSENCSHPDTRL